MQNEADEILVSYFVVCDYVLTEAGTGKQSLIGVYSALFAPHFPTQSNLSVALGIRVQSTRPRELMFRLTGPSGEAIFASPPLTCDWAALEQGIRASGFATVQIGMNLQGILLPQAGIYTATMACDGALLASYPLSVLLREPPAAS